MYLELTTRKQSRSLGGGWRFDLVVKRGVNCVFLSMFVGGSSVITGKWLTPYCRVRKITRRQDITI